MEEREVQHLADERNQEYWEKKVGKAAFNVAVRALVQRGVIKSATEFVDRLNKIKDSNTAIFVADILRRLPRGARVQRSSRRRTLKFAETREQFSVDSLAFLYGSISHSFAYSLLTRSLPLESENLHDPQGFDHRLQDAWKGLERTFSHPHVSAALSNGSDIDKIKFLQRLLMDHQIFQWTRTLKELFSSVGKAFIDKVNHIAEMYRNQPILVQYMETLTLMSWASLVVYSRKQPEWFLFKEQSVLPRKFLTKGMYRMSAGRMDGLRVIPKLKPFNEPEKALLRDLMKSQNQYRSAAELLDAIASKLGQGRFVIEVLDFKFVVGDGRGGLVNLDELFYLSVEDHIDQVQRYQLFLSLAGFYHKNVINERGGTSVYRLNKGKKQLRYDLDLWNDRFPAKLVYVSPYDDPQVQSFPVSRKLLKNLLLAFSDKLPKIEAFSRLRKAVSGNAPNTDVAVMLGEQTEFPFPEPVVTFLNFVRHAAEMVRSQRKMGYTLFGKPSITNVYERSEIQLEQPQTIFPSEATLSLRPVAAIEVSSKLLQSLTDPCKTIQECIVSNLLLRSPKEFFQKISRLRNNATIQLRGFETSFEGSNEAYKAVWEILKQTYVLAVAFLNQNKFFNEKQKLNAQERAVCEIVNELSSDISGTLERLDSRFQIDRGGEKHRDEADRYFTLLEIERRFKEFKQYATKENRPQRNREGLYAATFYNLLENLLKFYTRDRIGTSLGFAGLSSRWYWDRFYNIFLEITPVFKNDEALINAFRSFFNEQQEPIDHLRRVHTRILADDQKIREVVKGTHG